MSPSAAISEDDDFDIGTIRCQNIWIHRHEYHTTILRVSRQVNKEASAIFFNENNWIIVRVNKSGFGKSLKTRGFGVISSGRTDQIEHPILKLSVTFPSLGPKKETDSFLMTPSGIHQLPRALWTVKGMSEIRLTIDLHPVFASLAPEKEDGILYCLYQLRGISKVVLNGVNQDKHKTGLPRELTTTHVDANDILEDLKTSLYCSEQGYKGGNMTELADHAESGIAFLADCHKVYGVGFIAGKEETHEAICGVTVQLASGIARARFPVQEYRSVVKYSTLAMRILPISNNLKTDLLLLRAKAFSALDLNTKALGDLLEARELMPARKDVIEELGKLKKGLATDPSEALTAFKQLRLSLDQEIEAEKRAFDARLAGRIVFRALPDGGFAFEDHR